MCLIIDALCPGCNAVTPKSRINRCFVDHCTPEKSARYVLQHEIADDFFCATKGCKYNDIEYLSRWVSRHYGGDYAKLKEVVRPLVEEEYKKKAE